MQTRAVRLYHADDIRVESFELPEIQNNEVLIRVVTDTICNSTYKAVKQGSAHKRVPPDIDVNPVIIGHEMCGEILEVGETLKEKWKIGDRIVIQPALKLESGYDPGYSYRYIGGNSVYAIVPEIVLERDCMVAYGGEGYFQGSLVESLGCLLRGFKGFYHTDYTNYIRTDGAKRGGKMAILGGAGPMGLGAIELALGYAGVAEIVVTDINQERLDYAASKCTVENAAQRGAKLTYVNTATVENQAEYLRNLSGGGFDDVFVMAPVAALFSLAEEICREDGCVNFFAGPPIKKLAGSLNLYRVHYDGIHVVGTAGSIPEDTVETIQLIEEKTINPGVLVSHILGLGAVPEALFAMEKPNGAKKVCYNELDIPLVALEDFAKLGETDPLFTTLDEIVTRNGGLWCTEAEEYLLKNAPKIAEAKHL